MEIGSPHFSLPKQHIHICFVLCCFGVVLAGLIYTIFNFMLILLGPCKGYDWRTLKSTRSFSNNTDYQMIL